MNEYGLCVRTAPFSLRPRTRNQQLSRVRQRGSSTESLDSLLRRCFGALVDVGLTAPVLPARLLQLLSSLPSPAISCVPVDLSLAPITSVAMTQEQAAVQKKVEVVSGEAQKHSQRVYTATASLSC